MPVAEAEGVRRAWFAALDFGDARPEDEAGGASVLAWEERDLVTAHCGALFAEDERRGDLATLRLRQPHALLRRRENRVACCRM